MKALNLIPIVLLSGCAAVGPTYQQPAMNLPAHYANNPSAALDAVALNRWWEQFKDPLLNQFIEQGLDDSLDLQLAMERIKQAQATLRTTGISSGLSGDASAAYQRQGGSDIATTDVSSASLGAAFVIDLFGGIQREREAALADLDAARADAETARLAWLAELVSTYSNIRFYQQALALTRETLATRNETVEITRRQLDAGAATEYEVAEASALLATARAALPQYQALLNANSFALATLLNQPVTTVRQQLDKPTVSPVLANDVSIGIPADLLRTRPDVRSSEASLRAAVAGIGIAEASLYPSLSLRGSISQTDDSNSWAFGPSLALPLFNRGVLKASRDVAASTAKQAELDYRATVQAAVEDVLIAQSNLQQYNLRANALDDAAQAYQRALTMARENFRAGAITLLNLLDTDRSTASAQINAASARNDVLQAWASLQIATGAGASVSH